MKITLIFRGYLLSLVGYDDGKVELVETKSLSGVTTQDPDPWVFRGDTAQFPVPSTWSLSMPVYDVYDEAVRAGEWNSSAAAYKVVTVNLTRYAVNDMGQVFYIYLAFVPETQRWYSRRPVPGPLLR